MGEFIGLAVVLGLGLLICWLFFKALVLTLMAAGRLQTWIFHSDDPVLFRVLAVPVWIPLALFYYVMLFLAIISAVRLAKSAKNWWEDGK
jgi:hypothetical protein